MKLECYSSDTKPRVQGSVLLPPRRRGFANPCREHLARKFMLFAAILSVGVFGVVACTDGVPTSPSASAVALGRAATASGQEVAGTSAGQASLTASYERSGEFFLTKECSQFTGVAGSFCTVTSSNVEAIEPGARIIYVSGRGTETLDTDIVLDLPGPGNNKAFGHCLLDLATRLGECTLSGGTGKFTHFQASANVRHLTGFDWEWAGGTYSFRPHD